MATSVSARRVSLSNPSLPTRGKETELEVILDIPSLKTVRFFFCFCFTGHTYRKEKKGIEFLGYLVRLFIIFISAYSGIEQRTYCYSIAKCRKHLKKKQFVFVKTGEIKRILD